MQIWGRKKLAQSSCPPQQKSNTDMHMRPIMPHMGNQALLTFMQASTDRLSAQPISGRSLPSAMREKFERRFGVPLGDVQVHHNSSKPAEFGAEAYAQGSDIFVGPGHEHDLQHEIGHVVQQKQGLVEETGRVNGAPVNDDPELEAMADNPLCGNPSAFCVPCKKPKPIIQMTKILREIPISHIRSSHDRHAHGRPAPGRTSLGRTLPGRTAPGRRSLDRHTFVSPYQSSSPRDNLNPSFMPNKLEIQKRKKRIHRRVLEAMRLKGDLPHRFVPDDNSPPWKSYKNEFTHDELLQNRENHLPDTYHRVVYGAGDRTNELARVKDHPHRLLFTSDIQSWEEASKYPAFTKAHDELVKRGHVDMDGVDATKDRTPSFITIFPFPETGNRSSERGSLTSEVVKKFVQTQSQFQRPGSCIRFDGYGGKNGHLALGQRYGVAQAFAETPYVPTAKFHIGRDINHVLTKDAPGHEERAGLTMHENERFSLFFRKTDRSNGLSENKMRKKLKEMPFSSGSDSDYEDMLADDMRQKGFKPELPTDWMSKLHGIIRNYCGPTKDPVGVMNACGITKEMVNDEYNKSISPEDFFDRHLKENIIRYGIANYDVSSH